MAHRVLVVDDDPDNLGMLEAALEASGFDVLVARTCADARAQILAERPDALVADYSLADGTAVELLTSLGEERPRAAVVVTGFSTAEYRAAAAGAGFQALLVKPIALAELEQTLARLLAA